MSCVAKSVSRHAVRGENTRGIGTFFFNELGIAGAFLTRESAAGAEEYPQKQMSTGAGCPNCGGGADSQWIIAAALYALSCGQEDGEGRALPGLAFNGDRPAVLLDDVMRDGQS